ncbi:MAG: hypothetical protein ACK5W9_02500 [Bdellovibrionales bacterium]
MNKLSKVFFVGVLTLSTSSALASDWWWHTSYQNTDNPPKFCVRDGVFSGPVRCMDWDKAEALEFDTRKVFGAAGNPSVAAGVARAQSELTKAETDHEQRQKELKKHEDDLARLRSDYNTGSYTQAEFKALETKIATLQKTTADARVRAQEAKALLDQRFIAAQPTLGKVELQSEIARKGLLIKFTDLEKRLGSFEANIDAVETELNNTVLEAYVTAKLDKMANGLCEFKNSCDKDANAKKAAKKKLMDSIVSKELQGSASGRPATAAPAQR